MLRSDVIKACSQGQFAVYPVATIDEGITLLTEREAGQRGADNVFPAGSINGLIEARLRSFAGALKDARMAFSNDKGDT